MSDVETKELTISDMQIGEISDADLDTAFKAVALKHKEVFASIRESMKAADLAYGKYLNPDFKPDEIEAKKDRADLNRSEKEIAEKFSDFKAVYERPFSGLELKVKQIRTAIKEASGVVDLAVKNYEEGQKKKKLAFIQAYFDSKKFKLLPLDRIMDPRWLNKTAKMQQVQQELDAKIAEIYQNVEVLENIPDHGMMAKALYLDTMDMASAMRQVNVLKDNAARLVREQVEREERKLREQVVENQKELTRERAAMAPAAEQIQNLAMEALDFPEEPEAEQQQKKCIVEFVCRFWGEEENIRLMREFMNAHDIGYEKISARVLS